MYERKLENVREPASWALAFLQGRVYFSRSVGLSPPPGLDVKMHKRQVIPGPWLLAGLASGMHGSARGARLQIHCCFQIELLGGGGVEP